MARNFEEKTSLIMPTAKRRKTGRLPFPLEDLPDEIILKIFSFLNRKKLFLASLASKRMYNISQESSMFQRWLKINFFNKTLPTSLLEKVLTKGCKYLSLQHATLVGNLKLEKRTLLKCLDISNCRSEHVLVEVLASCYSLEKLCLIDSRLESINMNDLTTQNGQTLQVLNMINCKGLLDLDKMKPLIDNCVQLKELNLRDVRITKEAIDYLVANLTPNIEGLSLSGLGHLIGDNEIKILVSRCKNLSSLDLKHTGIRDDGLTAIIENLQDTLENLNVADTSISSQSLEQLDECQLLMILKCDGEPWLSNGVEVNERGSYFTVASSAYKTFDLHSHSKGRRRR
jgi:hypothetical protein